MALLTVQTVLFVPSNLCGMMPEGDCICFVISRTGNQVLINTGALSLSVAMGLASGLLTGQCETTLLPPLRRAQGLGSECTCLICTCPSLTL